MNKKRFRIFRILLLCVAVIAYLPSYISFAIYISETFFDDGFQHVDEVTEETYNEIAYADAMFLELPDVFEQSLERNKAKYSRDGTVFYFSYLESRTSHSYQFDNLVSNEMETKVCKIFNICYGVLVVLLLIPFESFTNCKQFMGWQ